MVRITTDGVLYQNGHFIPAEGDVSAARRKTIAYGILQSHNLSGDEMRLRLRFDALASHDITYVGIIQTARASGMTEFPVPYV
ncbi:MAG TPA: hypothetical protein PK597_02005, partial [Oscillospiraceae bacterium]|nr:hypothetical protein [Oscillospiraceae bacterium]